MVLYHPAKTEVNSGPFEEYTVPAPQVTHIMLLLNDTTIISYKIILDPTKASYLVFDFGSKTLKKIHESVPFVSVSLRFHTIMDTLFSIDDKKMLMDLIELHHESFIIFFQKGERNPTKQNKQTNK